MADGEGAEPGRQSVDRGLLRHELVDGGTGPDDGLAGLVVHGHTRPAAGDGDDLGPAERSEPDGDGVVRVHASDGTTCVWAGADSSHGGACAGQSSYVFSMATSLEWEASASMSARSPVRTVPPGSALATTRASIAEPRRASALNSPARRAARWVTTGSMSQLLRKRLMFATVRARPVVDSAMTTVGTTGGQSPSARKASISAAALRLRWLRRPKPPESRTSTTSACLRGGALADPPCDDGRSGPVLGRRLAHVGDELGEVAVSLLVQQLAPQFGHDRHLEQLRRRKATLLDGGVQVVGQVYLHPRHTPKCTHKLGPGRPLPSTARILEPRCRALGQVPLSEARRAVRRANGASSCSTSGPGRSAAGSACVWAGVDSNHGRRCRQIYSLLPLAARAPTLERNTLALAPDGSPHRTGAGRRGRRGRRG